MASDFKVMTATPLLIDTHAHLEELEDLEQALAHARNAGVIGIIAVGSDYKSDLKVIEISQRYPLFVYPALGLHPWELGNMTSLEVDQTLEFIDNWISVAVAIGEIGLDYDKRVTRRASKELQKDCLKLLLALAKKHQKPVIVHSRYAWQDCFNLVKGSGVDKAVFHWFTGFSSILKEIINSGYFISATPAAEYHEEHRRAIKEAPLTQILLETDCPVVYGREDKYKSQPSDILRTLRAVARLKGIDEAVLAWETTNNAIHLFGLPASVLDAISPLP